MRYLKPISQRKFIFLLLFFVCHCRFGAGSQFSPKIKISNDSRSTLEDGTVTLSRIRNVANNPCTKSQDSEDHIVVMAKAEDAKERNTLLEFVHSIQTATSMRIVDTFAEL